MNLNVKPLSLAISTMDALVKFLEQYKKYHVEETKEDRFIEKLRKVIQEERNVDLNKEREKMREEVMKEYQSDVSKQVSEKCKELQMKYKEEMNALEIKIKEQCRIEYQKKYAIYLSFHFCKGKLLLELDSEVHNIIDILSLNQKLIYHQECYKAGFFKR